MSEEQPVESDGEMSALLQEEQPEKTDDIKAEGDSCHARIFTALSSQAGSRTQLPTTSRFTVPASTDVANR